MPQMTKRAPRKFSTIKAKMRRDDEWLDVQIANMSASGLMIRCQDPPEKGAAVHIQRRGTAITGTVVWATPTRFGMTSDRPIDCEELQSNLFAQPDRRAIDRGDAPRRKTGLRLWPWQ